ncbi:hypothetical protein PT277_01535 [Acetobacteraceae bacterium ESL0709]|nr:hypothetical protein [Acetobacteraceae bacterium ESL0697]MDF7677383.1 hypothetical protein [Acetobacteraceae bacterium ESL0709]
MPALPWEELDQFLDEHDFAFRAKRQDGQSFPVIIDEEYQRESMGGYVMTSANPVMIARETDLATLKKRDRLTISGVDYWLTDDPEPDGTGIARAPLSRSQEDGDW